jgi:hypothetical protein
MANVGDGLAATLHSPEAYKRLRQAWFHSEDAWLRQRARMTPEGRSQSTRVYS